MKQTHFWSIEFDQSRVDSCLQCITKLVLFMLLKFLSSTSDSRNFWFLSNFLNSSSDSTEIADFSSDDEFSKEINCCLLFQIYYTHVAKLLLSIIDKLIIKLSFKLTFWTQINLESSCSHFQLNSSWVEHIFNSTQISNEIYLYEMLTTNLLQAMLVRRAEQSHQH